MDLGAHADFIIESYAVALVTVLALIGWVVLDGRRVGRQLEDFEARGITRRSDARKESA